MADEMVVRSYAKVNLTLDVLRRRPDGYHDVKMIMQTVGLHDDIIIQKEKAGIHVSANLPYLPTDSRNLVYRSAQLFFEKAGLAGGVRIHLNKQIPVAAGLAGGSGNAAATLVALNELYQTGFSKEVLAEMGLEIGADVPYCLYGGTMLAEGIGEKLTRLAPAPHLYVLLVKPKISVSTKKVYEALDVTEIEEHPDTAGMIHAIEEGADKEVAVRMFNVLQRVTESMHPQIGEIRSELLELGAEGSIMSGSGPTVFGVFEQETQAKHAYDTMRCKYHETFLTETITERNGTGFERI